MSNWSPALSAGKVLLAIRRLLNEPNPADPFDAIKGQLYMSDPAAYAEQAASWARKYAYGSWADAAAVYHIES
ncbi:Ubiquitin-conjugating enzyme E2-17 kDa [Diplonema papillatum]|nr:Ubiquitin-conjugating enzyme E2-17 kDa [Diplonema papillatum]